jgi:hypothetical protein
LRCATPVHTNYVKEGFARNTAVITQACSVVHARFLDHENTNAIVWVVRVVVQPVRPFMRSWSECSMSCMRSPTFSSCLLFLCCSVSSTLPLSPFSSRRPPGYFPTFPCDSCLFVVFCPLNPSCYRSMFYPTDFSHVSFLTSPRHPRSPPWLFSQSPLYECSRFSSRSPPLANFYNIPV